MPTLAKKKGLKGKLDEVFSDFNIDSFSSAMKKGTEKTDDKNIKKSLEKIDDDEAKKIIDSNSNPLSAPSKIKFYIMIHKDRPAISGSSWKMPEIHRILVNYFSRADRVALVEHLIKKDYYKETTNPKDVKPKRTYTK